MPSMANNEIASDGGEESGAGGGGGEIDVGGGGGGDRVVSKDDASTNHNFTEVKLEASDGKANSRNGSFKNNLNHHSSNNDNIIESVNNVEKPNKGQDKKGWIRHLVAVLALSSIVLANMNRQAFNQALVSMIRPAAEPFENELTTAANNNHLLENNMTEHPVDSTTMTSGHDMTTMLNSGPTGTSWPEVTQTDHPEVEHTTVAQPNSHRQDLPLSVDDDKFDWTGAQIATLQAAFSYGYTPFMIPGGRMSELYGAKWVVFISGFGSALCCALSPFFADTNYNLLVASRVLMGLCQTGVSPALYALLTRWLPPNESSVYLPMIKVAVMVGLMSGSLVSGFFTWRLTFYLVGFVGMLWSAMWALAVTSDPGEHKLIGESELGYIRGELQRSNNDRKISLSASRKAAAPWVKILTNPVVVGFMLAKFTVKLSTDAQTMQIPMYLKNVFMVSKELNGILSALNFAIQGIFTGLVAWLAKEFVVRKSYGLSKTGVRRLFQGTCNFGMAFAYILITFNMSSLVIVCCAVILLSVASMFGAGGEAVTPVDLSTDYSASIMAIANSSANLSGIILPSMVSFFLGDQLGSSHRWNIVWWIVGGISLAGGLVYTCRVDAEMQDFRSDSEKSKQEANKFDDHGEESVSAIEMKSRTMKSNKDDITYV